MKIYTVQYYSICFFDLGMIIAGKFTYLPRRLLRLVLQARSVCDNLRGGMHRILEISRQPEYGSVTIPWNWPSRITTFTYYYIIKTQLYLGITHILVLCSRSTRFFLWDFWIFHCSKLNEMLARSLHWTRTRTRTDYNHYMLYLPSCSCEVTYPLFRHPTKNFKLWPPVTPVGAAPLITM